MSRFIFKNRSQTKSLNTSSTTSTNTANESINNNNVNNNSDDNNEGHGLAQQSNNNAIQSPSISERPIGQAATDKNNHQQDGNQLISSTDIITTTPLHLALESSSSQNGNNINCTNTDTEQPSGHHENHGQSQIELREQQTNDNTQSHDCGRPRSNPVDHYDDDEGDGDEEDDDEEEDDDDEADCDEVDEDIDYCSDQSSTTSTSSTNNPTDNTRVCDCCYCEVFGHGVPPVAPTSRNYQEMRERLRQRLSKRRAEGCDKVHRETAKDDSSNDRGGGPDHKFTNGSGGDSIITNSNTSGGNGKLNGGPLVDQRNLDELLNYINGTSQKEHDKLSGKRKDKQQNNNKNNKGTNNKNNKNINSNCKSHQHHHNQQQSHKYSDQASPTRTLPNTTTTTPTANSKQKRKDKDKSTDRSTAPCGNDCCHMDSHANGKTNSKSIPSKKISIPSQQNSKATKGQHQNLHQNQNQASKINNKKASNNLNNVSAKPSGDQVDSARQHRDTRHGVKSTDCSRSHDFSCTPPTEDEVDFLSDDSSLSVSPEDVFKPKDIDLENGDMDELERELEAFKRFCFDSTPLVRKERVRVQLKNWFTGMLE